MLKKLVKTVNEHINIKQKGKERLRNGSLGSRVWEVCSDPALCTAVSRGSSDVIRTISLHLSVLLLSV